MSRSGHNPPEARYSWFESMSGSRRKSLVFNDTSGTSGQCAQNCAPDQRSSYSWTAFNLFCKVTSAGVRKVVRYETKIPDGRKVWASNHPSNLDPCYFYHRMDRPAMLVMDWGFKLPVVGRVMEDIGFISVVKGDRTCTAFMASYYTLMSGRSVYICPEGKTSTQDSHHHAKTGAARLARIAAVPIIPIGIRHEGKMRKIYLGKHFIRWMPIGKTHITFGAPLIARAEESNQQVTSRLMEEIRRLACG